MTPRSDELSAFAGLLFAWIFLAVLSACGAGQAVLSAQAQVVQGTAPARIDLYERSHEECLETQNFTEYRECMAPSRHLARAVDSYAASLRAAQAALNASGEDAFRDMLPCLVAGAADLTDALVAANLPIPAEVAQIADMAGSFSGSCHE